MSSGSSVQMSSWNGTSGWFALTVQPNHEQHARLALRNQGFETYLPVYKTRRRWSDRIREAEAVLFPGYLFCRFEMTDKLRVLRSAGVASIVGIGKQPVQVDEEEISAIRGLISTGGSIAPWPYLRIGQNVVIEHGPLAQLRGVILRVKDTWRVVVSVEALGCSVSVEVDSCMVAPQAQQHGIVATSLH